MDEQKIIARLDEQRSLVLTAIGMEGAGNWQNILTRYVRKMKSGNTFCDKEIMKISVPIVKRFTGK